MTPTRTILLLFSVAGTGCSAITSDPNHVDWSATGSMLGGIGAIAAATGTGLIILLTWRYVRINAGLLKVNRESLQLLRESVLASRDMAEVMRHQLAIASADVEARTDQEHEPFRHLVQRMISGSERVRDADLIAAFHGTNLGLRPDASWFIPPDYRQKVEMTKDLDGVLHQKLNAINEPPHGEFSRLQQALGRLGQKLRPEYRDVPREAYMAANEVNAAAKEAITELQAILAYIDERANRLRKVAKAAVAENSRS